MTLPAALGFLPSSAAARLVPATVIAFATPAGPVLIGARSDKDVVLILTLLVLLL
jgi:hypothetical protein